MPQILIDALDIAAAIILALLIRRFVLMPVLVKGRSMNNTLQNGEFLLCLRFLYQRRMKRGDIVICHYPGRTHRVLRLFTCRTCFVKRLVALPGDVIEVIDGVFTVNGHAEFLPPEAASRPYANCVFRQRAASPAPVSLQPEVITEPDRTYRRAGSMEVITRYRLKENECFVMGDHRAISNDCRRIGPIDRHMILGNVPIVFLPLKRARRL